MQKRSARDVKKDPAGSRDDSKKDRRRGRSFDVRQAEDAASEGVLALPMGVALFALVLALYVKTAYPTVPGGDAGELVFTSCSLGVAHPPGMWVCAKSRTGAEVRVKRGGEGRGWREEERGVIAFAQSESPLSCRSDQLMLQTNQSCKRLLRQE